MADPKITGHCSRCNKRVFDVLSVFEPHELYPGEPKQIGAPEDDAVRVTFLLHDGARMQLTFCEACAESLALEDYAAIWDRVVVSWGRETQGEIPDWMEKQLSNGLLCMMARESWKKVIAK